MKSPARRADRYGLVGHPVEHSRSPLIHGLFAESTGQRMTYELLDAAPHEFEVAVLGFKAAGGKGLNVTVPHKERAFELARECSDDARAAGAVNTFDFAGGTIVGHNTDGVGFMRDLVDNLGQSVEGKRVVMLGAGGAAKGVMHPILQAGPKSVVIANRTLARAEELIGELVDQGNISACSFDDLAAIEPPDFVINATSAGLKGEDAPFPQSLIAAGTFCYDLSYSVRETPFVSFARAAGAEQAVQGWGMLIEQAAESFFIWRGVRPDTAPILEKMRR